jgi:hypothetical protein
LYTTRKKDITWKGSIPRDDEFAWWYIRCTSV